MDLGWALCRFPRKGAFPTSLQGSAVGYFLTLSPGLVAPRLEACSLLATVSSLQCLQCMCPHRGGRVPYMYWCEPWTCVFACYPFLKY